MARLRHRRVICRTTARCPNAPARRWDDEDRVLFVYDDGDFKCKDGGMAEGDLLIGINGQGNSRGRPAGSGFYLVTLDEGECKVDSATTYGCKFDAKGNPTTCGVALL